MTASSRRTGATIFAAIAAVAAVAWLLGSRDAKSGKVPAPSGGSDSPGATGEARGPASARRVSPAPSLPPPSPVVAPANEAELLSSMRESWQSDPTLTLTLAKWGDERFGETPKAVERRYLEIKALVRLERIGKARSRAESLLELYPPGPMTDEIERLTGVHRRPQPE
jgi:hypothetical protein